MSRSGLSFSRERREDLLLRQFPPFRDKDTSRDITRSLERQLVNLRVCREETGLESVRVNLEIFASL